MARKKKKRKTIKTFLIPKLRSASLYWPARQDVYERIRVERGKYACEMCGEIKARKEIAIDHINPIISIQHGFNDDWTALINALYCEADGLQGLCKPCHSIKTMQEDEMRRHYKAEKKREATEAAKKKYKEKDDE